MKIIRAGSLPSAAGPGDYFTGQVRMDNRVSAEAPGRVSIATVTFEPGARTAWHTHPCGQTLIVTQGLGRACCEGGQIAEIRPGDIVWFPAGLRHWHGAAPDVAMTHIAVQEAIDGSAVTWLEQVSDADYRG